MQYGSARRDAATPASGRSKRKPVQSIDKTISPLNNPGNKEIQNSEKWRIGLKNKGGIMEEVH